MMFIATNRNLNNNCQDTKSETTSYPTVQLSAVKRNWTELWKVFHLSLFSTSFASPKRFALHWLMWPLGLLFVPPTPKKSDNATGSYHKFVFNENKTSQLTYTG